ncbi:MAG: hypothetical protein V4511_15460 [Bacteroidota bacterium]
MKKNLQIVSLIMVLTTMSVISCKKGNEAGPTVTVTSKTYSVPTWSSSSTRWYTQLSVPELTSGNINTAAVQVYFGLDNTNWTALPNTVVSSTNYFMGYMTTVGTVQVNWDYNGIGIGSSPNTFYSATSLFKVVVIPPAAIVANPDLDLNNYNTVKAKFNIAD